MYAIGDLIVNKKTGTLYKITYIDDNIAISIFYGLEIQQVKAPYHKYYPYRPALANDYEGLEEWTSRRLLETGKKKRIKRGTNKYEN